MDLFGADYDTREGTCVRDYVHVMDLADAHLAALDRLMSGEREIIANLGTSRDASVMEFLRVVEAMTGSPPPYRLRGRREGDGPVLSADLSHGRSVLGFEPRRSAIDKIIAGAWRFHEKAWGLGPAAAQVESKAGFEKEI